MINVFCSRRKLAVDISCKLSAKEKTVCLKTQSLFSREKKKIEKNILKCHLLNLLPNMLCVDIAWHRVSKTQHVFYYTMWLYSSLTPSMKITWPDDFFLLK